MQSRLEKKLYQIWYADKKTPWYLYILGFIFNCARRLREFFYTKGWNKSTKIAVPVFVVGNINVGGSGKSPLVAFLVKELQHLGRTPGIISRGHGSDAAKSVNTQSIVKAFSKVSEVGDEALMLQRSTGVPVVVGKNRVKAANKLLEFFPEVDVIISDDGLQHYALQRDLELLVVDGITGFGNQQLLPAGPLREPMTRLESVDLILTKGEALHRSLDCIKTLEFSLKPSRFMGINNSESMELHELKGKTVHAFAGIGHPEQFYSSLEKLGITVIRHALADHASMPVSFFEEHKGNNIVMTEKDAVKYPGVSTENIWYLPVSIFMQPETKKQFMELIQLKIGNLST